MRLIYGGADRSFFHCTDWHISRYSRRVTDVSHLLQTASPHGAATFPGPTPWSILFCSFLLPSFLAGRARIFVQYAAKVEELDDARIEVLDDEPQ